jgi:hypothetical protein
MTIDLLVSAKRDAMSTKRFQSQGSGMQSNLPNTRPITVKASEKGRRINTPKPDICPIRFTDNW